MDFDKRNHGIFAMLAQTPRPSEEQHDIDATIHDKVQLESSPTNSHHLQNPKNLRMSGA